MNSHAKGSKHCRRAGRPSTNSTKLSSGSGVPNSENELVNLALLHFPSVKWGWWHFPVQTCCQGVRTALGTVGITTLRLRSGGHPMPGDIPWTWLSSHLQVVVQNAAYRPYSEEGQVQILSVQSHLAPVWATLAGIPKRFAEKGVGAISASAAREVDRDLEQGSVRMSAVSGLCLENPAI